jgi:hypothetical protein
MTNNTERNQPCPCGSGKKFKHCCDGGSSHPPHLQEVFADLQQLALSNPGLSREDFEIVMASRMRAQNSKPSADLCGLSPEQMHNWLYAPWNSWQGVNFSTPADVSGSPVMRYLEILLDNLLEEGGSIKLTPKGNLPVRIVQQCADIAEQLPSVGNLHPVSISEYRGRNEDDFNALHYTRLVAQEAGVLYQRSGRLHARKDAQKKYRQQGIGGFYADMLESAVSRYNWGYMDLYSDQLALQELWLFMLWRLHSHGCIQQLGQELAIVIKPVLDQLPQPEYSSKEEQLTNIVSIRFVWRFLGFFGLVRHLEGRSSPREDREKVEFTPLMAASFTFRL